MPVLIFRDLGADELKALQERDESDDEEEFDGPIPVDSAEPDSSGIESDETEIVVEGGEQEEPEEPGKPSPTSLEALGGRLVRGGQLP
jgi:hypothetical protein